MSDNNNKNLLPHELTKGFKLWGQHVGNNLKHEWKHVIDTTTLKLSEGLSALITGVVRSKPDERDFHAHEIFETESQHNENTNHHIFHPHIKRLIDSKLAGHHEHHPHAHHYNNLKLGLENANAYVVDSLPKSWVCFDSNNSNTIGLNDVYNQYATNECVAYSFCTLAEFQIYHRLAQFHDSGICFSKARMYSLRSNKPDEGMSGRDACEIACKYGFIRKDIYDKHKDIDQELNGLVGECEKVKDSIKNSHLIKGYSGNSLREQYNQKLRKLEDQLVQKHKELEDVLFHIDNMEKDNANSSNNHCYAKVSTVDSLKKSIYFNGPCPSILPFYPDAIADKFWYPGNSSKKEGELGHCISFVGWDDDQQAFLIRNSWGKEWNHLFKYPGHTWFPYADLEKNIPWETWTIFYNGKDHLRFVQEKLASKRRGGASTSTLESLESLESIKPESLIVEQIDKASNLVVNSNQTNIAKLAPITEEQQTNSNNTSISNGPSPIVNETIQNITTHTNDSQTENTNINLPIVNEIQQQETSDLFYEPEIVETTDQIAAAPDFQQEITQSAPTIQEYIAAIPNIPAYQYYQSKSHHTHIYTAPKRKHKKSKSDRSIKTKEKSQNWFNFWKYFNICNNNFCSMK